MSEKDKPKLDETGTPDGAGDSTKTYPAPSSSTMTNESPLAMKVRLIKEALSDRYAAQGPVLNPEVGEWDSKQLYMLTLSETVAALAPDDTQHSSPEAAAGRAHVFAVEAVKVALSKGDVFLVSVRQAIREEELAKLHLALVRAEAALTKEQEQANVTDN